MPKPRDYRDDADIDESLDCIRIATRDAGRELLRACLDTAYQQGRCDMLHERIRELLGDGDHSSGSV